MSNNKTYSCGICNTTPDQISHHKSHTETQKHKDKRELFEIKLSKLDTSSLMSKYGTINIQDIVRETETKLYVNNTKDTLIKKLKSCNNCDVNHTTNNETMSDTQNLMNTFETEMSAASNKEALKNKIHEIHNYLRNNGAGYGMNALKVFNIIYGLKKIEECGLLGKVSLKRPECEFSYLLGLANSNKEEELAELIFGDVLGSICESELRELLFYEIPKNIRGSVFVYLLKEINKITVIEKTCNVLLSGKIYEYFIGRDESAISELGAYFTVRYIVDYILKKVNPSVNADGSVPSMIDMFGGSGGFTTGYINHLNEKYPGTINWESEINKISHFDMNEDVIKSAGLEFFCLTGVLPNMRDNLKYSNSFIDEFNNKKYMFPLTNPPYGGDDDKKTKTQNNNEKIKKYIKEELSKTNDEALRIRRQNQLKDMIAKEKQDKKENDKNKVTVGSCSGRIQKFASKYGLQGNDKELCSLMLLMDIVEYGGTAAGVLKEGVLFNTNKMYKDARKCLVENFNVREIISVPQDQFENTSTKTSIVIFDNTSEKTSLVKFSNLIIKRCEEDKFEEILGDIYITESKGDIVGVSDELMTTATKEEILANTVCSLNGKDYNKKQMAVGEGYKLQKIKNICTINKNTEKLTADKEYNFVKIGNVDFNTVTSFEKTPKSKLPSNAKQLVKPNDILVSCVRPKRSKVLFIQDKIKNMSLDSFVFSTALVKLEANDKNMAYFIYLMLYLISDSFEESICKASQYPRFKPCDLEEVNIPIPSTDKISYWTNKIMNEEDEDLRLQYIEELKQEAMPQATVPSPQSEVSTTSISQEVTMAVEPTTKIKKVSKKSKKLVLDEGSELSL